MAWARLGVLSIWRSGGFRRYVLARGRWRLTRSKARERTERASWIRPRDVHSAGKEAGSPCNGAGRFRSSPAFRSKARGPDQASHGRGSGLSLAAPLPAIRSRSDRASPPTTGDRASLASSRFAKVRDRPGARVSSAQGTRAAGNVSQGAAFTYPEPWRFRKASGSIVSVRPLGCPEADFPTPLFFNRPVPRSRSRRLLHPIDSSYIIFV